MAKVAEELPLIDALRGLAMLQQELLRFALFVASQGPATFEGETITCTLRDGQRRASTLLAMAASQSMQTILEMTTKRGIAARDAYSVARSTVETFINAAFLASESDDVAARAIKHVRYATWKLENMRFGRGEYLIDVHSDPQREETLAREFPEFRGKGKGVWSIGMAAEVVHGSYTDLPQGKK